MSPIKVIHSEMSYRCDVYFGTVEASGDGVCRSRPLPSLPGAGESNVEAANGHGLRKDLLHSPRVQSVGVSHGHTSQTGSVQNISFKNKRIKRNVGLEAPFFLSHPLV